MTDQPLATLRQKEIAVGIDLGTTKSAVAYVAADGRPSILSDVDHRPLVVPTAVHFGQGVLVGEPAVQMGAKTPDLYAEGFKREIGKPHFHRRIHQRGVPPEVLCAFVLQWLKQQSQGVLGDVQKAVITVPAYYNETRRKATREAGRLAGLDVLDIINEPTAAAVAYGYLTQLRDADPKSRRETIMVYDFGGGTFDVSILRIEGGKFSTLATDGDIQLGGCDFDERLADYIADRFLKMHGTDPRGDAASMHGLLKVAQDAKHRLTESVKTTAVCTHAKVRMGVEITREALEELIDPLVERTLNTCLDVLQEARLGWSQIDRILLVGGSSYVPLVAKRLAETAGKPPTMPDSPELLVAHGAALLAALRSDRQRLADDAAFDIVNVNAHSLGIASIDPQTREPVNTVLIPRNTSLPAGAKHKFVTRRDNQSNVAVNVLEGESENPKFCTPIGKCIVQLEPGLPMGTDVVVSCQYKADGLISVSARVPATKRSAQVDLRRDHADVLDPLSVWQTRLTLGEEPAPPAEAGPAIPKLPDTPLAAAASTGEMVGRLDYLYRELGQRAQHIAVPPTALAAQRAVHAATSEMSCAGRVLDQLTARLQRAADRFERRELDVAKACANAYRSQAESFAAYACLALGRELVEAGVAPPGSEPLRDEALALRNKMAPGG